MVTKRRAIVLLNPPYRRPVLRDYYCSTFPKAFYYWQPIDLLSTAAILNGKSDILMIDAVAQRLTVGQVKNLVEEHRPDAILVLVSTLSADADLAMAKQLASPGRRMVLGGEVALDPEFDFQRFDFVDGLLLDFTDARAVDFLAGAGPAGRLRTPEHPPVPPLTGQQYSIGLMPHKFLDNSRYRMPLWRGDFYSLLTDFGCPFACSFCNSGKQTLGFRLRDLTEVAEEARQLKQFGAERVFLKNMTFGADQAHATAVLSLLAPYGFKLRGYLRADLVTRAYARQLKEAGFELAQIGVESPTAEARSRLRKKISDSVMADAFQTLRREGIQAGAHFIVGFEHDRAVTVAACVRQARSLGAAYCSINIYQHRLGTSPLPAVSGWRKRILSVCAAYGMAYYNLQSQGRFMITGRQGR